MQGGASGSLPRPSPQAPPPGPHLPTSLAAPAGPALAAKVAAEVGGEVR